MEARLRLIVHRPEHARAACAAAGAAMRPVIVQSPPGCAGIQGVPWFLALVAAARPGPEVLAVVDCGTAPGLALAALRGGAAAVRLNAAVEARARAAVADIAAQMGAVFDDGPAAPCLDLLDVRDPDAACRRFLGLE